ncbi:MAG: transposase [Actinobacteria bacterium]|nr:transposase [Actinomycetota bacterium]
MDEKLNWKFCERNDRKVAGLVREGSLEAITGTGWGFLDKFFSFLYEIGFFKIIDIPGRGYKRILIPLVRLITTYSVKILLGISSMNKIPDLLFREVSLLKLIGFTAQQIKEGSCKRGKGSSIPINKSTLSRMLERLSTLEVNEILASTVKTLVKNKFVTGSSFVLDATDIPTTDKCAGRGVKTVKIKKYQKLTGEFIEVEKTTYGFKLIVIWEIKSRVVVAAKVVKTQEHESKHALSLIEMARQNLGESKISLLLIDAGFVDGVFLFKLKHKLKIDFIVRARKNMHVSIDARSLAQTSGCFKGASKEYSCIGIENLSSYSQYNCVEALKNIYKKDFKSFNLNAVVVTGYKDKVVTKGRETVFLTSLDVKNPCAVVDYYDDRSLIENRLFRELKQGWNITKIPMKKKSAVISHTILTLVMYSLNACYQTEEGKKLAEKGIRKLRDADLSSIHKIIVFAGSYFAIFDIEEYSLIVRSPPKEFFRINPIEAKKRLGLKD